MLVGLCPAAALARTPRLVGPASDDSRKRGLARSRQSRRSGRTSWSSVIVGIAVPTREEMQEIEVSSRLYVENGARYMTATLMCQSDTATPKTTPVTFILVRPSAGHGALRRAAPVHDRRQQARAHLPGQRHRRDGADGPARRRDRPRRRHPGAHRRRGRPGLARYLRARAIRAPSARDLSATSSRRSAARAT